MVSTEDDEGEEEEDESVRVWVAVDMVGCRRWARRLTGVDRLQGGRRGDSVDRMERGTRARVDVVQGLVVLCQAQVVAGKVYCETRSHDARTPCPLDRR